MVHISALLAARALFQTVVDDACQESSYRTGFYSIIF
jgi:hypothetical protein